MENGTIYAYKLQHIDNPTFENVQRLARTFINDLPQPMVDEIYEDLNRGVDQLTTEPQMLVYLHSFGSMHEAKLRYAFNQLPDAFREQPKVNIIDYGCGQAIGTMCYTDFLRENGIEQNIGTITLIEPSEICLRRAALHVSQFFPDAEIRTVCKTFDDLTADDIANDADMPTLHILSNVLDIQEFDLEDFASLIADNLNNYNQFVCVGPYFNYSDKDERMTRFAELLNGNVSYSKIFEKGELCDGKTWTAQIVCFSNGELEVELSTEVTKEDIENGVEDEYGVVCSVRLNEFEKDDFKCRQDIDGDYYLFLDSSFTGLEKALIAYASDGSGRKPDYHNDSLIIYQYGDVFQAEFGIDYNVSKEFEESPNFDFENAEIVCSVKLSDFEKSEFKCRQNANGKYYLFISPDFTGLANELCAYCNDGSGRKPNYDRDSLIIYQNGEDFAAKFGELRR